MRIDRSLFLILLLLLSLPGLAQLADKRREQLDVLHYKFSILLNDDNDTIRCAAIVTIKFLQASTGFDLDLVKRREDGKGMMVSGVVENNHWAGFSQQEQTLHINSPAKAGETHDYAIAYEGIPADGLIINKNKFRHRTF